MFDPSSCGKSDIKERIHQVQGENLSSTSNVNEHGGSLYKSHEEFNPS